MRVLKKSSPWPNLPCFQSAMVLQILKTNHGLKGLWKLFFKNRIINSEKKVARPPGLIQGLGDGRKSYRSAVPCNELVQFQCFCLLYHSIVSLSPFSIGVLASKPSILLAFDVSISLFGIIVGLVVSYSTLALS